MNDTNSSTSLLNYAIGTLWNNRWFLVVPAIICTLLAFGYAIAQPSSWTASQSLIIRDDLLGDPSKPGRFESMESLKSAQETVQQIARKPVVLRAALEQLGQEKSLLSGNRDNWPDQRTIELAQNAVNVTAPGGTEFGKSEVIVLTAKSSSPERAKEFARLIIEQLETRVLEVRKARIQSMTSERKQTFEFARKSFEESASRLQQMEQSFGANLSTVRSMNDQNGGDGPLQRSLTEIQSEKREAESTLDAVEVQRELLINAMERPERLTATSSELLQMQPRLQQLVAGLNAAEIKLAELVGKFRERHPDLVNGREAVVDIKMQIQTEIKAAIESIGTQIDIARRQYERKASKEQELESQLSSIAAVRVDYSRLEQEVQKKSQIFADARERLAGLQSFSSSSEGVGLLTMVGNTQVPIRADGASWKMITALGGLCGLLCGLGMIILFAPSYKPDVQYPTPPIATEIASVATTVASNAVAAAGAKAAAIRKSRTGASAEDVAMPGAPQFVQPTAPAVVTTPVATPQLTSPEVAAPQLPTAQLPASQIPAPQIPLPQVTGPNVTAPPVTPPKATLDDAFASTPSGTPFSGVQKSNPFIKSKPVTAAVTPTPQPISSPAPQPVGPAGVVSNPPTVSAVSATRPAPAPVTTSPPSRPMMPTVNIRDSVQTAQVPGVTGEASASKPALTPGQVLSQRLDASIKPSAEDIVREIRRRKQSDTNVPASVPVTGKPQAVVPVRREKVKSNPVQGSLNVKVRQSNSPDVVLQGTSSENQPADSAEPELPPNPQPIAIPIPDQIKSLSESIASFCELLNTNNVTPRSTDNF